MIAYRQACFVRLAACLALLVIPASATGQSITSGSLIGAVINANGSPMPNVSVWVTNNSTGVAYALNTSRNGRFSLPLLPPGSYDVKAELLGYRPQSITNVPVRPGRQKRVEITLRLAAPPVDQTDLVPFATLLLEGSYAVESQWFMPFEIEGIPHPRREITQLTRLSTVSNPNLETEGLPGRMSGLMVDGIPYDPVHHPELPPHRLSTAPFPLSSLGNAELVTNGVDVEWTEFAGGYLSAYTQHGTKELKGSVFADWSGDAVSGSDHFDVGDAGASTIRAGAWTSGPVIDDTVHYSLGFEFQRLETPRPPAWEPNPIEDAIVAVASDSFNVDLTDYVSPRVALADVISAFGRFDWNVTQDHWLNVRSNFAWSETGTLGGPGDPDLGRGHTASLGSEIEALDFSASAMLSSTFGIVAQELRFGIESTHRDYRVSATSLLNTEIVDGGFAFGVDPTLPGEFDLTTFRGSQALYLPIGPHRLKFGVAASTSSVDQRYAHGQSGEYFFAGVPEFAGVEGAFSELNDVRASDFSVQQFGTFLQDTWSVIPGFDLVFGLRWEFEQIPDDEVRLNQEWLDLSGLDNTSYEDGFSKWSPRFAFIWDVGDRNQWLFRAGAGVYHDRLERSLFSEVEALDGRAIARRGVGDLVSWPQAPDPSVASVQGPRLSLFGPDLGPPRTERVTLGLSRLFRPGIAIHVSGTYRHTELLPRRVDLNLATNQRARDQYGREIFGEMVKQASAIAVEPGSNRRFNEFDLVSALNPDGFSNYWDITVALERRTEREPSFYASYTYSRTRDNWLSGRSGGPDLQLNPFPRGLNGADWSEGISDFDVPHELIIAAEWNLPRILAGLTLAGLYQVQSGIPFTAGFRDGVDANGDGSSRNDPAFVDGSIVGTLFNKWKCLRLNSNRFADRNACRGPAIHGLDLRLGIGPFSIAGSSTVFEIDALNLLEAEFNVFDDALFLVDRDADLTLDGVGTVVVPLRSNPNFGQPLVRNTTGRSLRVGVRVGM